MEHAGHAIQSSPGRVERQTRFAAFPCYLGGLTSPEASDKRGGTTAGEAGLSAVDDAAGNLRYLSPAPGPSDPYTPRFRPS